MKILIVIQELTIEITLKISKKYSNHPSTKDIKNKYKNIKKFSFRPVTKDEVKKVIKDLKTNKSVGGEIPIQILKESEFTFECLKNCLNHSIEETGIFPSSLKLGNITPIFKRMILLINRITDQLVYCLCYQKFMNELFIISCHNILNSF